MKTQYRIVKMADERRPYQVQYKTLLFGWQPMQAKSLFGQVDCIYETLDEAKEVLEKYIERQKPYEVVYKTVA